MNISNFLRNKLIDKAISGTDFTPATNLFIRLFTTTLNSAGAGTEQTGAGYAPKSVTNNTTNFPAAVSGVKSNASRIDMDAASADWASDTLAIGIFDASTAGNLYFYKNLDDPLSIESGQNIYFNAGDISFTAS